MEKMLCALVPVLMAVVLVRLLVLPLGFLWKLGFHAGAGFLCLGILNSVAPFTGILLPVNAATILTAGFLGLPGIGLMAALAVF